MIYCLVLLMAMAVNLVMCDDYVVAYVFQDSLQQKMLDNQVRIYEKSRYNSEILMNKKTRSIYANLDILKNMTNLSSKTILQSSLMGKIQFKKSPIPQNMWIQNMQVIIVEIDVSSFPKQTQQLQQYTNLFRHKGSSMYIFNTDQIDPSLQMQIAMVFDLMEQDQQICQISMHKNTLEENKIQIEECYKKSRKRIHQGKYQVTSMSIINGYGMFAAVYIIICGIIACGSPYFMIYWYDRQKGKTSPV